MFKVALFQILPPDTYHYEGHVDQKKEFTDSVHKWNLWCNPNPNPSHSLARTDVLSKQRVPNIEVFKSLLVWIIFVGFPRWVKKLRVLRATPSPTEVQQFGVSTPLQGNMVQLQHEPGGPVTGLAVFLCSGDLPGRGWWWHWSVAAMTPILLHQARWPICVITEKRNDKYADDAVSYLFVWHRLIWFQGCSGGQFLKRAS